MESKDYDKDTTTNCFLNGEIVDILTKEQCRKNMQHIRSKDTNIELLLRKKLWEKGYRYRKNYDKLPGKTDIVLTKYKIAIFCDGAFFHGKDWEELKPRLEHSNNKILDYKTTFKKESTL